MKKGMSNKVYRDVYRNRAETFINQSSYRDIILLEAEKSSERKFKLNSKRTATIKIKRNK